MARHPRTLDEKAKVVTAVEAMVESGLPLKLAIQKAGISCATYYRDLGDVRTGERPAVRKDWFELARGWRPGGGLTKLGTKRLALLRRDVAGALRQTYGHPVRQHLAEGPESLAWFLSCFARACEAYDLLDNEAREHLLITREPTQVGRSFSSLFESAKSLGPGLAAITEAWEDHLADATAYGEGSRVDPRVARLVVALATIWRQYSGKPPSHTIKPANQRATSRFNKFVLSVESHFLSDQRIPKHALYGAMRHTSAGLDWSAKED